jgi:hypothetical protein
VSNPNKTQKIDKATGPKTPLAELRGVYDFPAAEPKVPCLQGPTWFGDRHVPSLSRVVDPKMRIIVELGSFLGRSTRALADMIGPDGTVIAVDTFKGSSEHVNDPSVQRVLPVLYETFLRNCWGYRDRIIPVREDTISGLHAIDSCGVVPDLIYVDAAHDTESVMHDIIDSHTLFPSARICGDDWAWESVRSAVQRVCQQYTWTIGNNEAIWWIAK